MHLMKKANRVKNMGIASIMLFIFGVLFIVGSIIYTTFFATSNGHNSSWFDMNLFNKGFNFAALAFGFGILLIAIGGLLWLIAALTILFSNWQNPNTQTDRVVWGLLSLFLLGPIAIIIFGSKAQKRANTTQTPWVEVVTNPN